MNKSRATTLHEKYTQQCGLMIFIYKVILIQHPKLSQKHPVWFCLRNIISFDSPLCSSTPLFHSQLKNYRFTNPSPMDFCPDHFFWATWFLFLVLPYFFVSVPCARLSWPSHQLLSAHKYIVSYHISHIQKLKSVLRNTKHSTFSTNRDVLLCKLSCMNKHSVVTLVAGADG